MTKAELINELAEKADLSKALAERTINALADITASELKAGNQVYCLASANWICPIALPAPAATRRPAIRFISKPATGSSSRRQSSSRMP